MKKTLISLALVLVLVISLATTAFAAEAPTADWPSFRGNDANNGITHALTPRHAEEAKLNWAVKHSTGFSDAPSPMILAEDSLIVMYGKSLKKLSLTDGSVIKEVTMAEATSWGSTPALYADGKIFCQLGNSTVQAFDAKTLESLWTYTDEITGGQAQSPITYSDGKIYVGLGYNSESPFICLDAATGDKVWRVTDTKGFYWAGAVVVGNYVIYGTENGVLYSRNKLTGDVVTELKCSETAKIRSTVSYDNGKLYWMVNDATVCRANINTETGAVTDLATKTIYEKAQSTSTIAIYNGVLYTAAGSWKTGYSVVALNADTLEVLWEEKQPAYPQCSMLVSDAYIDSGYVYLYVTYNKTPGGMNVIKAKADGSEAETLTLFTPETNQQQYCICSVIAGSDGTLYYKNDSGNVFSIGLTDAAQNQNAANAVIKQISDIGEVTLSSAKNIKAARDAYNALTDAQKALVTNLDVLTAAEAKLEQVKDEATANPVDIYVTIANKGNVTVFQQKITVTDINNNGMFDVDDALYIAHENYFEGGAAAGYGSSYGQYGLGLTKLWGDTNFAYGYWLNNGSCWSLEDQVAQGDHLVSFVYTDGTNWSDAYTKFEKFDYTATAVVDFTVKLEKAGYDASWNTVFSAHAGATVAVYDSTGKALTEGFTVVDKGDGSYTITINAAGSYYVVATDADPLTAPAVCAVTVEENQDLKSVISKIDALGSISLSSANDIQAARTAYNALTDAQKALVTNYKTLTDAETRLAQLKTEAENNQKAADAVVDSIKALGDITLASANDIQAARAAYDALTDAQKALVTNYKTLTGAESALTQLEADAAHQKTVTIVVAASAAVVLCGGAAAVIIVKKRKL